MEKEFSFTRLIKYLVKWWFVTAASAVILCLALSSYAAMSSSVKNNFCMGSLTIAPINIFYANYDTVDFEQAEGYLRNYKSVFERAQIAFSSDDVKKQTYDILAKSDPDKIQALGSSPSSRENVFYSKIQFNKTVRGIDVSYVLSGGGTEDYEFGEKVVKTYMDCAIASAEDDNQVLQSRDLISKSVVRLYENMVRNKKPVGRYAAIGFGLGALIGIVAVGVMYFTTSKIVTYGDIAYLTGYKLLGMGEKTDTACPIIDAQMNKRGAKVLLVLQPNKEENLVGKQYYEYATQNGYKSVMINLCGDGTDDIAAFLSADMPSLQNVELANSSPSSRMCFLPLKEQFDIKRQQYDRIILVANNKMDGTLAPLGVIADSVITVVDQTTQNCKDILALFAQVDAEEKNIGGYILKTNYFYIR